LRQEVFGLDAEKRIFDEKKAKNYADDDQAFKDFQTEARQTELIPYSVATHNCEIQLLQERDKNRYAVFMVKESEAISYAYERNPEDPRIAHTLTLETDELGNVLEAVSVVYPRLKEEAILQEEVNDKDEVKNAKAFGRDAQKKQWVTFTQNDMTTKGGAIQDIITPSDYYLRQGWQTKTFELTGLKPAIGNTIFKIADFKGKIKDIVEIEYQATPQYIEPVEPVEPEKRLIEHVKTKFYNAALTAALPDGEMAIRGIPFEAYQLAYTRNLIDDIFTPTASSANFFVSDLDMRKGKFLQENTDGSPIIENPTPEIRNPKSNWWIQSGTVHFHRDGEDFEAIEKRFFAPVGYTDPFDSKTTVKYDPLSIFMEIATDDVGNESGVVPFHRQR
jgi:hypothetical protein